MRICLEEDNGLLNDGKPTLVVLVIDGKTRIPYEATKTIQELYIDARKYKDEPADVVNPLKGFVKGASEAMARDRATFDDKIIDAVKLDEIEREDIVKCIKQEKDIDGNVNEEIEVGKEYRVIDIYKSQGKLAYYEVLDDAENGKIRIPILPREVELVRKHIIQPRRSTIPDMIKKCGACGEQNAILLNGDKYEGKCEKCGADITAERPNV